MPPLLDPRRIMPLASNFPQHDPNRRTLPRRPVSRWLLMTYAPVLSERTYGLMPVACGFRATYCHSPRHRPPMWGTIASSPLPAPGPSDHSGKQRN